MDNKKLAQLLFPDIDKTPEYYEEKYPERDLPEGAKVTRLGPSPTGFIHLGNLYGAFVDERLAHQSGGVFFLRIEDTDDKREVEGAVEITKPAAEAQTENGTSETPSGTDLSSWVNYEDITSVSFSLADAVSYRTAGASKAIPGFDVIDYGQEDYVFGNEEQDARHWDTSVLKVLQEHADILAALFNAD